LKEREELSSLLQSVKERSRSRSLHEAERELAAQLAGVGMWWWTIEPNTLVWDARMCDLFGVSEETEKTYETFFHSVVPEDRERVQAAIDLTLAEGTPYVIDYTIQLPDGTRRKIHARGRRYPDCAEPEQLIGVCMAI
jgi:PAS domain-containing protein